jgi:RNA polymerase sigma-70 factor, ECF subfamily
MKPARRDSVPAPEEGPAGMNEGPRPPSKPSGGVAAALDPADRDLVRRAQEGDHEAFRALFSRYHRRAYAVAFGVVKNEEDALDVVQDGFVKVHRHIHNFQGTSSFYTWLYRIIMNLAIDHVRRRRNAKGLEYDDRVGRAEDDVAGDGALLPRMMDANPGKTVIRRELLERIQGALEELPEYHRAVILLREVEGLSYEEMSQVLEVPKGTIMSRLFHARKKMQASLSDYMEGDLDIED